MRTVRALTAVALTATALLLPTTPASAAPAVPSCDGRRATIVGTSGDDHLVGTSGPDVIVGLGGDDRIEAGAGNDVVCGLAGADTIDAGSGDDRVFGGIDAWSFDRGGANRVGDRVSPGPGRDYVDLGADRRQGTETRERDTLVYATLDHAIRADLSPGDGRVVAQGVDTVRVHGQMGVVGTAYDDTITGSPKADTLKGLGGDDRIEGRGGNDLVLPGGGADTVDGDFGNDTLSSWSGADVLVGGPGNDFVDTQSNPDVATVSLGPGADQLNTTVRPRGGFDADAGDGRDTIVLGYTRHHDLPAADLDLGSGAVTLGASGTGRLASFEWWVLLEDQALTVHGTDKAERIEAGGKGPVTAWMAGGDDAVFASRSDDFVDSGAGEDQVWAYRGTDTCLNTEHARDCEIRQAPGRVQARTVAARCHGFRATLTGTPGPDRLVGTSARDVIVGGRGRDQIDGGGGDDVICAGLDGIGRGTSPGGAEYETIRGDVVKGGPGDDLIDLGYDARQERLASFGRDVLKLDGRAGTTLHLAGAGRTGTADGHGHDRVVGQRRLEVSGSPGPDRIWGSPYADDIDGRRGDDVIFGLGGADALADGGVDGDRDRVVGGAGPDSLVSSGGADVLQGGPGEDELAGYGSGVTFSGGAGDDHVAYGRAGTGCADVVGGGGRDELSLRPSYDARHDDIEVGLDGGPLGPCGSVRDVEKLFLDYGFGDHVGPHWVVSGTDRGDWVRVFIIGRLTAHLRGGDDTMIGADRDDLLDGGPGDDTAFGRGGHDACPRVERTSSCEA